MKSYEDFVIEWEKVTFGEVPSKEYYSKCEAIYNTLNTILPMYPPYPIAHGELEFWIRLKEYNIALSLCGPKLETDDLEEDSLYVYCFKYSENTDNQFESIFEVNIPTDMVQEIFFRRNNV